jgi:hypothetical protein
MSDRAPFDDTDARAPDASGKSIYVDWDAFLKVAIKEYYDRGFKSRKGNFIALLIASGQTAFALAKDSVVDGSGTKKVAIGAALALALRVGLKYAIGGPLGLVLTVASGAAMISYFVRNQKDIVQKVGAYRTIVGETHVRYDELQGQWKDGKFDTTAKNLMIDGLMKRFLTQCDEA